MAKITIQVDDDVFEQLQADAQIARARTVEAEAADRLKRFVNGSRAKRLLILQPDQRQQIELVVGTVVGTADELIRHVKNLSNVKIGSIERPLTDSESIRLREQATFHGQTPDEFIKMVIDEAFARMLDRF